MSTQFSDLNLRPELEQALDKLGYTEPTPIQAQMIPIMLTGVDVIGQAQTGTGKTAAFSLPVLHNLIPGQKKPQALILSPTRELAMQVAKAMEGYGSHLNLRVLAIYGGSSYSKQLRALKRGVDVVVGTPGRLLDLLQRRKALDLSEVRTLVLDEADEMLSMGFIDDIETLLDATANNRQIALFSATMPHRMRQLAGKYLNKPETVTIKKKQLTVAAIEQRYYLVNHRDKFAALSRLFETEDMTRTLIFVRTRVGTGELANALAARGISAEMINGDLSQDARERVMSRFKNDRIQVLVATDVAARGLDINNISHVVNYDLPEDPEVFVHRIGRTGRAGKDGVAISLLSPRDTRMLRRIESYTRQKQTQTDLPTKDQVLEKRRGEVYERMEVWLTRGRYSNEMTIVEKLAAEGHEPMDIAAAALRVMREQNKEQAVENISKVNEWKSHPNRKNTKRNQGRGNKRSRANFGSRKSHEAGMVRLSLDKGRTDGIRPGEVVGTLAYHAKISGKVIGAISIQDQNTFVDVPENVVDKVLAKNGDYRLRDKTKIVVERA
ncbi:MAG: DEAD/DEAH box helicase [Anaerolineae bacterium]|jgi:ATP-dependent RNA helicase DeaD|nr:DEAD/DEAH box helicase [Anaerolineae bacterium]MBT4309565.1 DEAD/DEAH box helicase [Anaerolineae bacterium]MBT4458832.1 DEAD/DEAH box helicase [Anaerolineae bacterium]MBT4842651.1 DEAD/DEAH box helicase [Anaerolineae bacterium]MBT6059931.1 DEAD/DEAH box helicase [Anaerolineae bacterium]